jgi:hypothetical protein
MLELVEVHKKDACLKSCRSVNSRILERRSEEDRLLKEKRDCAPGALRKTRTGDSNIAQRGVISKDMSSRKVIAPTLPRPKPVVKGPIRCHKCQMLCRDSEEYLSHSCDHRAEQPQRAIFVRET